MRDIKTVAHTQKHSRTQTNKRPQLSRRSDRRDTHTRPRIHPPPPQHPSVTNLNTTSMSWGELPRLNKEEKEH